MYMYTTKYQDGQSEITVCNSAYSGILQRIQHMVVMKSVDLATPLHYHVYPVLRTMMIYPDAVYRSI